MSNEAQKTAAPVQDNAGKPVMTAQEKTEKLNAEIKKTWNKLSDEDIALFDKQQDQFFAKLQEKHSVSKEDAQTRLTEIKASCGSCSSEKAA